MNGANQLKDCMNAVVMFFRPIEPVKCGRKTVSTFVEILSKVRDFRDGMKIKYRLGNLLFICFYLALKGEFTSFYHVSNYLRVKQDWFVRRGLIKKGEIPSHDTFMRVFQYLDANSLRDVFLDRIKYLTERLIELDSEESGKTTLLSGDGKEVRGSGRKGKSRNINVFNIYNASNGLCVSSTPLTDKDSEIREFQRLLPKFNLKNCLVTADALHCQRKTCSIITDRKGDYVIKVKGNQEELKNDVIDMIEKNGDLETVRYNECDYRILVLPKEYIGAGWPGARAYVKMNSHKRIKQRDYNPEDQYFVASTANRELIMEAIDNRWCIEGDLHQFKDVFLDEDACSFTHPNAVKTMATLNNIVYALYRLAAAVNDETMDETKIRYRDDPFEMLSLLLPLLDKKNVSQLIGRNMRGHMKKK